MRTINKNLSKQWDLNGIERTWNLITPLLDELQDKLVSVHNSELSRKDFNNSAYCEILEKKIMLFTEAIFFYDIYVFAKTKKITKNFAEPT